MGKLREAIDKSSSSDIILLNTLPASDTLMKRYREECGPVVTKPLVEWCTPAKINVTDLGEPAIHIGKGAVTLNKAAVELLGVPERVKVGVTYDGLLAVQPTKELLGYKLSLERRPNKGVRAVAATLGKDRLVKWLLERGLSQGYYRLEKNEKLGIFVGKKLTEGE